MKIRKRTINVSEKALASNNDLFFHFIFYYSTKKRKKIYREKGSNNFLLRVSKSIEIDSNEEECDSVRKTPCLLAELKNTFEEKKSFVTSNKRI
jgi:hypothetical protein